MKVKVIDLPPADLVAGTDILLLEQDSGTKNTTVTKLISDLGLVTNTTLVANSAAQRIGTKSGNNVQVELDKIKLNATQTQDEIAQVQTSVAEIESKQEALDQFNIDLQSPSGADLIQSSNGNTVQEELNNNLLNDREQWRRSLAEAGLTLVDGSFEEGATLNNNTDAVWYIAGGQCYTWGGAFPKEVPAGSTPETSGGVGSGAWVSVGDANLRQELASSSGFKLIGSVSNVTQLRTITGSAGDKIFLKEYNTGTGKGGGILTGVSSPTLVDDGVSFFRVNSSFGWARDISKGVSFFDGGVVGSAVISGPSVTGTDDTAAVLRVFSARLPIRQNTPLKMRLTSSVTLGNGIVDLVGAGSTHVVFVFDHLSAGLTFGSETNSETKYQGTVKGVSCVRPNYLAYAGSAGPKSLSFGNFSPIILEDVREENAIGFGIFFVFCRSVVVRKCYAGNHVGTYSTPKSGTDGIHFYKCNDVWAYDNILEEIGDDAISSGSFDPLFPCSNINFIRNKISRVHGSMKLYSFVDGAEIAYNRFRVGHEGGVYLTNDANSLDNSYVKNIKIHHNEFFDIIGSEPSNNTSGGVRLRFWPDNSVPNSRAIIDQIYITDNLISGCGAGIAAITQDAYKRFSNMFIRNNSFRAAPLDLTGSRPYIRIHQFDYELEISGNTMVNSHSGGIVVDQVNGSFTATFTAPKAKISGNTIDGYSLASTLGQLANGVLVRPSDYNILLEMVGNQVRGQAISDTLPATQGILVNNVSPLSFIEANQSDNNIAIGAGSAAYKGIGKTKLGAPNAGTHYAGSTITDYVGGNRYTILTNGTFGTLNGVTGTTVAGSKTVTLNSIADVYRGCVIAIAGVSGNKRVLDIQGTTIKVDVACDTSVSNGAVSYVAPTFRTEAM